MKRLSIIVAVAAMAALISAPVAAAKPFQNVFISNAAALVASIAPNDGRNTQLLILGSDYREVSGGVSGSGGSFAQSFAFVDGIQRYCDAASNDLITRNINGLNLEVGAAGVTVHRLGNSGRIQAVLADVLVSEFHLHYPEPGCTGLDPVLTFEFGTATITLDVTFSSTAPTSPAPPLTLTLPYKPGLGVDVSISSQLQAPAVLSGTVHATDPDWDIGDVSSVPASQCFIAKSSNLAITVRTP